MFTSNSPGLETLIPPGSASWPTRPARSGAISKFLFVALVILGASKLAADASFDLACSPTDNLMLGTLHLTWGERMTIRHKIRKVEDSEGNLVDEDCVTYDADWASWHVPQDRISIFYKQREYLKKIGHNYRDTPADIFTSPGPIPQNIARFYRLRVLNLQGQQLTGNIPYNFGSLTKLEHLNLSQNQLSGSIPRPFMFLISLKSMDLSGNPDLTGPIPSRLLRYLDLNWDHHSFLRLGINLCIPANAPTRFTVDWNHRVTCIFETDRIALEKFFAGKLVGNNGMTYTSAPGTQFSFIDGNKRATHLLLGESELTGEITPGLGDLTQLQQLELYKSRLSGSIPSTLGNLSNLKSMQLYSNELTGMIPSSIGNLSNLTYLGLSGNLLRGSIPSSLGKLSSLKQLELEDNQLSGLIPLSLGNLSNLERLQLQENQLSGVIPSSLGNLSNLKKLLLQGNKLSGPIPSSLGNLSNLTYLGLQRNRLSGSIPPDLGNLSKKVWRLDLTRNQLSGAIPSTMWNFRQLFLEHNLLEGPFPIPQGMEPGELPLTSLNVRGNDVCFPIDPVTIEILTTDNPEIRGGQFCSARRDRNALIALYNATGGPSWTSSRGWSEDPSDIESYRWKGVRWKDVLVRHRWFGLQVTELSLPDNKLSGTLPSELGNLVDLETLVLRDNDLVGPLPESMIQLSKLKYLDISGTELCAPASAAFGQWLGSINFIGTVCAADGTVGGIALSVHPTTIKESGGPTWVQVTATLAGNPRSADVDVRVTLVGEVARESTDFESITAFIVKIPSDAKSGSKTFTFRPIDDDLEEGDETLVVRGTATLGSQQRESEATLTVVDDDKASTHVSVTLDKSSISESVGAAIVTVTAKLDGKPRSEDTPFTVTVNGSGVEEAVDFAQVPSFAITIPAGKVEGTGTFVLTPENDTADERNEILTVSGTAAAGLQVHGATLTLRDDDSGDPDSEQYFIRTVAGHTDVADAIPATSASLNSPGGVAVDAVGNVYVADRDNDRIRKIDPSGIISTFAGTGNWGYGGDGGPATDAALNAPSSVVVDAVGNVYIADEGNHRVRMVDVGGIITTVAGTGRQGDGGDGGLASEASLYLPRGVAVDANGNLLVADSGHQRVRKVDAGGIITTVAGTGHWEHGGDGGSATEAGLRFPTAVATDSAGNMFVATGSRVRKIDAAGIIMTFAGTGERGYGGDGGPATRAQLNYPTGLVADAVGNVYVADSNGRSVRKIDASGFITTFAGTGTSGDGGDGGQAADTLLSGPFGVALDPLGNVYVSDMFAHKIRRIDPAGIIRTAVGTGEWKDAEDTPGSESVKFRFPKGAALDPSGNLYFSDDARVWKLDAAGTVRVFAGADTPARLLGPWGLATDAFGNVYVADRWLHQVFKIDARGNTSRLAGTGRRGFGGDGGPAIEAQLLWPSSVAVDPFGNVYVADAGNHRIRMIDSDGRISTIAGTGEWGEQGEGGPAIKAQLSSPHGLAADSSGNVYVAEEWSGRVLKIDPGGNITLVTREVPALALSVDDRGDLYAASREFQIVRISGVDGEVSVIAGTGEPGFVGDGGPAEDARLSAWGIAVDADGKVWFTDAESRRVRVLERPASR